MDRGAVGELDTTRGKREEREGIRVRFPVFRL